MNYLIKKQKIQPHSTVKNSLIHHVKNIVLTGTAIAVLSMGTLAWTAQNARAEKQSKQTGANKTEQVPIRGIVRASARASVSTNIVARVTKVGFKEGQVFRKGDLLIKFDCRHKKAELRSFEARKREIVVALKSALFLKKRQAGSRNDVDIARARLARANADADVVRFRLKACAIYAPYSGRIASLDIHEHEMSSTNNPLLTIVALRNPKVELVVPSNWLTWLTPGTAFKFSIDETGRTYNGTVTRLGATVIAVNQTIKVFAKFTNPTNKILPGMSGTAKFAGIGD